MDLSRIPVQDRLDALLDRLDASDEESGPRHGDFEEFVGRRATQPPETSEAPEPLSDVSDVEFSDVDDANAAGVADFGGQESVGAVPERQPEPESSDAAADAADHNTIIASIYADAGVEAPAPARKETAREQRQRQEAAAREDQEMRREMRELAPHTTKTYSIDDFLSELASGQPARATKAVKPVSAPPAAPVPSDDLEIVGASIPRPVRDLLRFGAPKAPSTRRLAQERRRLHVLETRQTAERRAASRAALEAGGIDVDAVTRGLAAHRKAGGGVASILAREQQRAAELAERERESGDESGDESEEDVYESILRKKMLSDSESEAEDAGEAEEVTKHAPAKHGSLVPAGRQAGGATQYVAPLSQSAVDALLDDASDGGDDDVDDELDEALQIVRHDEAAPAAMQPDLRGIRRLPAEQQRAEIRQRYLKMQAEAAEAEATVEVTAEATAEAAEVDEASEDDNDNENNNNDREQAVTPDAVRPDVPKWVDDQAELSDSASDDDETGLDRELAGLVDDARVAESAKVQQQFLADERRRDETLLTKVVAGVHGGWRRGGAFLDDDGSDDEAARLVRDARRASLAQGSAGVARLAASAKAQAFFSSISEDLVSRPARQRSSAEENLSFLRSFADQPRRELNDTTSGRDDRDDRDRDSRERDDRDARSGAGASFSESIRGLGRPAVQRPRTVLERSRALAASGSTYAARISTKDLGERVEITTSAGRAKQSVKPRARFVAPLAAPPKRRLLLAGAKKASWK